MPLASLIVEDGTGLSTANSYVTFEEARDYTFRILNSYRSAWLDLDQFQVEQLCIWATQLLDDWVYFPGVFRLYQHQALNFPVTGLVDQFGVEVLHSPLPSFLKRATSQLAFELSKSDLVAEPTRGIAAASVGPLSVTFDVDHLGSNTPRVIPRSVAVIVIPFGGVVRGSSGIRSIPVYRS